MAVMTMSRNSASPGRVSSEARAREAAITNAVAAVLASSAAGVAVDAGRAAALGAAAASVSAVAAVALPRASFTLHAGAVSTPGAPSGAPPNAPPGARPTAPPPELRPVPRTAPPALLPVPVAVPASTARVAIPDHPSTHPTGAVVTASVVTAPPSSSPALPSLAAAHEAGRHAGAGAAAATSSAIAAGIAAGRRAAAGHGGAPTSGSAQNPVGALEDDLHAGVAGWTGEGGSLASDRTLGFILPVPSELLRSAETTRATLQALCSERTIAFGPDDSDQSLKASLLRFNACASNKAGAELQWLAVHTRRQAMEYRGPLTGFQAVVAHPTFARADQASEPPASSRPRRDPPAALFATPARTTRPQPLRQNPTPAPATSPASSRPPTRALDAGIRALPFSHVPPSDKTTSAVAGAADERTPSSGRRPSTVHAARMLQSMLEEEAQQDPAATSQQVADVQSGVSEVLTRLKSLSQSQSVANARLDGAFVGVVNGQTAVMAAAAEITASLHAGKRPSGTSKPPSKKAKTGGASAPKHAGAAGKVAGGGAMAVEAQADPRYDYFSALVHDCRVPVEMMTAVFVSQPLFKQLAAMVRMCHVSVDHPGLFGSYACHLVYEEGIVRTAKVVEEGGKAGPTHDAKTSKMKNVVRNKADHWLKQLYWLHGVLPMALKPAEKATYEEMQKFKFSEADCTLLTNTIKKCADAVGWPPSHPIRIHTKARVSTLRQLLGAMTGRIKVESNVGVILGTAPFDELLAVATENVRKKYT